MTLAGRLRASCRAGAFVLCLLGCAGRPPAAAASPLPGASAATRQEDAQELSRQLIGGPSEHCVRAGDTLEAIAARHGEPLARLLRDNGIDARTRLRPGQCLRIDNPQVVPPGPADGVLINVPQRMLFLRRDDRLEAAWPVAVGRPDWPTPLGRFRVTQMRRDPVWHVPVSIQEEMRREGKSVLREVPSGPENPLGHSWIGLDAVGYGIHGTNAPSSIHSFRTHGCVRLNDDHATQLFQAVRPGVPVHIIYRTWLLAELPDGQLWLQANPDPYHRGSARASLQELRALAAKLDLEARIDWPLAQRLLRAPAGLAARIDRTD
jgi:L,D-transpeptidase ErfK/SrfK